MPHKPLKTRRRRISHKSIRIAIIIRTKDRPHLLTRCLQGLADQKRLPDEVIIINDGGVSIDKVVKNFSDLNIKLINNTTNQGRSVAGNQGVNATNCDVFGFLDDDDRFLPDHLQRLEKVMLHFDARVAYSGCRLLKRDMLGDKVILEEKAIGEFNDPYNATRLRYENYIPLINLLIDRALWLEVGGFDESFDVFEDWDVLQRLSTKTHFYHLNRITTEYAVWGNSQITQRINQDSWRQAYRQFLKKHVLVLPDKKLLQYLTEYWLVSQERRGMVQGAREEAQELQLDLIQKSQDLEQSKVQNIQLEQLSAQLKSDYSHLQADWTAKYQQLQSDYTQLQSDWIAKYEQLQSDWQNKYEQLQSDTTKQNVQLQSDWQNKYEQLQSEATKQKTKLQSDWQNKYEHLQSEYTKQEKLFQQQQAEMLQLRAEYEKLQNSLHELSKQIAVGMMNVVQSQPGAYALATSSGSIFDDYYRLINWIRDKAQILTDLEQQLTTQIQALRSESNNVITQTNDLIKLISASRWPQVRRYANLVQAIDNKFETIFSQTEHYISSSTDIAVKLGLNTLLKPATQFELPSPRPLSDVYPTFMSVAGTSENPQFMENVHELGTIPFMLDAEMVLVFTVYCPLDNFFRLDVLLATRVRINTCQLRLIIRELDTKEVLRVIYLDAIEVFDNRYHPISFEAIADSAGKTYQVEIDSPDANEQSGIAVWCHAKKPHIQYVQQLPEHTIPNWLESDLLSLPISTNLNVESASHLFILHGIVESTPTLNLHIFLARLTKALKQANTQGNIIIAGKFSSELRQYCQQQQLTTLELKSEFTTILKWAKTQQAEYLWCCEINALPQQDIIEHAIDVFVSNPNAALLVPMEKHSDGTIRAGYASLMRDGLLSSASAGAPANHPYYNYRRIIEAANSQLITVKIHSLSKLDFNKIAAYHTPMYQLTELIWQLKDEKAEAIYEAAVCYEHDQTYPEFTEQDYNHDSSLFYKRWNNKLPTHTAPFARHLDAVLNPQLQPTVLVIDATLPTYDEDSGSLRIYTLLKIWVSLGYQITFFPDNLDSKFKYRHALEALGIEVFHSDYGIADAMAYRQFDFAFICRVNVGHRYIPYIRSISPETKIFYDTVDIHYIREQRQAEIENNPKLALTAEETKRKELSNCLLANRVITVTQDDAEHLKTEIPNLDCSVIPNIHKQQELPEVDFKQRDGLVFIGNYNHQPNDDAVYAFIETVLPKIHARLPEVCLYLIGSHMKDKMKALASETVKIIGWVDEVEPEFAKRRVFVSYLRYGAGMKGKLGQALSAGLPVVSTNIGAEGMGLVNEETALIADDADKFADAVCRLYTNSELWEKLSRQGRDYIEERYGETAVRNQLKELLDDY
jgi:glycosyltransferase involved in cell wall biosynthesis